ncbi:MAG: dehydrogenase [Dysgonamonadaceae bacterium]|jgi:D-glycero-alpha-D-manno-heptose-7-phosphate kinase|nr:dehydrogenase [Dysgonamonadaceae bacterium]
MFVYYRSKAPFRLGIAGGGTDVSPYSDLYGGAILNVTINLFAHATIRPLQNGKIRFVHVNESITEEFEAVPQLPAEGPLILQQGIYNSIVSRFNNGNPLSFELTTQMDVSSGSGLGTSSSLVVAILGAFTEWLKLPLGKYDIAHYAYEIERLDLKMAGGKQDQYSATFGGVNFMEFMEEDKVIVNPLRISNDILHEWALNTVLFFTEKKRESSRIIEEQMNNVRNNNLESLNAMHIVKQEAFKMKNNLLRGELQELGEAFNISWVNKKKMARHISNDFIDRIYETALSNGALGGKISGAGGGGFMFFYCPGNTRYRVVNALENLKAGKVFFFDFYKKGMTTWTAKEK